MVGSWPSRGRIPSPSALGEYERPLPADALEGSAYELLGVTTAVGGSRIDPGDTSLKRMEHRVHGFPVALPGAAKSPPGSAG